MTTSNYSFTEYPWQDFLIGKESFDLFGYGSLVNEYSSQKVIKDSNELVPVTAFGIKRILNYDPDENVRSRCIIHSSYATLFGHAMPLFEGA